MPFAERPRRRRSPYFYCRSRGRCGADRQALALLRKQVPQIGAGTGLRAGARLLRNRGGPGTIVLSPFQGFLVPAGTQGLRPGLYSSSRLAARLIQDISTAEGLAAAGVIGVISCSGVA